MVDSSDVEYVLFRVQEAEWIAVHTELRRECCGVQSGGSQKPLVHVVALSVWRKYIVQNHLPRKALGDDVEAVEVSSARMGRLDATVKLSLEKDSRRK